MSQFNSKRFVLASRPEGKPSLANFRIQEESLPPLQEGEVLLRTLYLSLDPYMRGRMSDAPSYAAPVALGETMTGEAVSQVLESRYPGLKQGDIVLGNTGWKTSSIAQGDELTTLGTDIQPPSYALGVLGMPGFTAWYGLLHIGASKAGETVVVSAATGAVGSIVGQIAKMRGCRVVGIAGDSRKCHYAVDTLGFDLCVDRSSPTFSSDLVAACPDGIDVDFESAGGAIFEAIWPLLNVGARVVVCGLIAQYNDVHASPGPDRLPSALTDILFRRIKLQGFIILDHYDQHFAHFTTEMTDWLKLGSVKFREDITEGFENTAQAFLDMLEGRNFGKAVVHVANQDLILSEQGAA